MGAQTQKFRKFSRLCLLEERDELGIDPFGHEVGQVQ